MSKIIRSLNSPIDTVGSLDLGRSLVGPPRKARPAGGFSGQAVAPRQPHVSCVEAAQEQARELIDSARRDAEKIQREAWHAGFEQGEKAGERLALQKIQPAVDAFAKLIDAVSKERASLVHKHEQELIKIAFLIAAKVVQAEIDANEETISRTVEAALGKLTSAQQVKLCIAPQDMQFVQNGLRMCMPAGWSEELIAIEADETVHRGGCKVFMEAGMIDATIESQLRMMKERLWEEE